MTSTPSHSLSASVGTLRGVGPKLQQRLEELGLCYVEDILYHFPLRYQDRTKLTAIGSLKDGVDAVIQGSIRLSSIVPGRRPTLIVKVEDGTGMLTVRFFHFRRAQAQQMKPGLPIALFGQARRSGAGLDMVHPEYRLEDADIFLEAALTPIYPTVEGLGQGLWRKLTDQALIILKQNYPEDLLHGVADSPFALVEAIQFLHRPPPNAPIDRIREWEHPAQLRLALEELVAHNLSLQMLRAQEKACLAVAMKSDQSIAGPFLSHLPFQPTAAQQRVIQEIARDMTLPSPMLRLIQGDVGSGKTFVAAMACITAIEAGQQVALMAPTELLGEQHLQTFKQWLEPFGVRIAWLSGRVKGRARRAVLQEISDGSVALVVGTHALFQEGVTFASLALVIVDEQHRFGVHQRLALTEKASGQALPHQLVLTATPIPRTLSMVAYADLDCSVIDELPPGRTPVQTTLLDSQRRDQVIQRVGAACGEGRQAYWVCTLIEESENLDARAAEATAELLQAQLPNLNIGLIHGRLPPAEKEAMMAAFKAGKIELLVATTVIEVGVDVPNASLMIIENPERLGLAQLHQLRGRVGRGSTASHCVLLYQAPLSQRGRERLDVMRRSNDGFYIAEQDLLFRGPGELLGTRQTGLTSFRVAQLPAHEMLLEQVAEIAECLVQNYPDRCTLLVDRWTGERQAFARV
jgi:ATP-dependent DNA helicase RecG